MRALLIAACFLFAGVSHAAQLEDPEQEARAQNLMREIRCVACENEPISNSGSDIAADMRDRVRVMIAEGNTDAEIRDWFAERYGEIVLFRPRPDGAGGWLLWGGPFVLLLVGGALILAYRLRGGEKGETIQPVDPEDAGSP